MITAWEFLGICGVLIAFVFMFLHGIVDDDDERQ